MTFVWGTIALILFLILGLCIISMAFAHKAIQERLGILSQVLEMCDDEHKLKITKKFFEAQYETE